MGIYPSSCRYTHLMWDKLLLKNDAVKPEFWQHWETYWSVHFVYLRSFFESKKETGVDSSDLITVRLATKYLEEYITIQLDKDQLLIDPLAYKLARHYLRNSLHAYRWLADMDNFLGQPLSANTVRRLLKCLDDMKEFWDKLKAKTTER